MSPALPALQDQTPTIGKAEIVTVTDICPRVQVTQGGGGLKSEGKKERE